MAGGSPTHREIAVNILVRASLRGYAAEDAEVFNSDVRVCVSPRALLHIRTLPSYVERFSIWTKNVTL